MVQLRSSQPRCRLAATPGVRPRCSQVQGNAEGVTHQRPWGCLSHAAKRVPADAEWECYKSAGSPRLLRIRASQPPVNVGFYVAGPTGINGRLCHRPLRHALLVHELPFEIPTPPVPLQPKPDRAALFQAMLDSGLVRSRAELARALGCSRAWVTKVLGGRAT
jgi:hypothetical protein